MLTTFLDAVDRRLDEIGAEAGATQMWRGSCSMRSQCSKLQSAGTRRLYAADWRAFVAWCRQEGQVVLPAAPALVAAYPASLPPALKPGAWPAALPRSSICIGGRPSLAT